MSAYENYLARGSDSRWNVEDISSDLIYDTYASYRTDGNTKHHSILLTLEFYESVKVDIDEDQLVQIILDNEPI